MKYHDILQKVMAFVLSGCLLLGVSGCGGQTKPESSENQVPPAESQNVQDTEKSYHEYNSADFGRKHTLLRTIADKDLQIALKIYNMEGAEGGQNTGLLFKTLFVDLEGNSGFNLTYIDTVGGEKILGTKQFYYKVEVEDIEIFKANIERWTSADYRVDTSRWSKDDEIYLQCDFFPPEKQNIQFYFRFKNYSVDETQDANTGTTDQIVNGVNEAAAVNPGTIIVETAYYTVDIPTEWEEYCTYKETSDIGEHRLIFRIKDEYMENDCDGTLLELVAVEGAENLNDEQYTYICQICEYRVVLFDLMRRTPEDVQVKEQYQEFLLSLQEFIPYVVQSIDAKDGYTLSYEPMEIDDGIPYVDTWIDILGTKFEPNGLCWVKNTSEDTYGRAPLFYYGLKPINDVQYCQVVGDVVRSYEIYGVRDGLIVAYMDSVDDDLEVHTLLTADFDGITPKIITNGEPSGRRYLIWELNNGYFVIDALDYGRGYLYAEVIFISFFADKEMYSFLTDY